MYAKGTKSGSNGEEYSYYEEVSEDDSWGESNTMNSVSAPTKTEMIITGARPASIDRETYNEKNVSEAIAKIRNARMAEKNFGEKTNSSSDSDSWGDVDSVDDDSDPWE